MVLPVILIYKKRVNDGVNGMETIKSKDSRFELISKGEESIKSKIFKPNTIGYVGEFFAAAILKKLGYFGWHRNTFPIQKNGVVENKSEERISQVNHIDYTFIKKNGISNQSIANFLGEEFSISDDLSKTWDFLILDKKEFLRYNDKFIDLHRNIRRCQIRIKRLENFLMSESTLQQEFFSEHIGGKTTTNMLENFLMSESDMRGKKNFRIYWKDREKFKKECLLWGIQRLANELGNPPELESKPTKLTKGELDKKVKKVLKKNKKELEEMQREYSKIFKKLKPILLDVKTSTKSSNLRVYSNKRKKNINAALKLGFELYILRLNIVGGTIRWKLHKEEKGYSKREIKEIKKRDGLASWL
ncbi:MAG: hypothetical protein U9Q22_06730 [Candidatus Altiarchaeota archaeon]|nr:hypothetical protein [Candidatus Altiarchaeota archaeon]